MSEKSQAQLRPPVLSVRPRKKVWVAGISVLILIFGIVGILLLSYVNKSSGRRNIITELVENQSPTPFPFQEMTIPYLRNRTYESSLGSRELIENRGSYSAHSTSYQSDGLKINGLLTIPNGQMPKGGWPAIVFIHGYIPPNQYETNGQAYATYVDYLANQGFVVFKIDLRGHGTSEGEAGGGYYGSDYVVDALNAYSALQHADFVNPGKIGLWGHSMAGNIVLRAMAVKPDIPASVIWAGAVYSYEDQQKYGIHDNSYRPSDIGNKTQSRRRELLEKYGSPSAESPFWQEVAPTNYLNDLKGAIEIHHAVDDDVVNIGYSRDLLKALDKTQVPHQLFEYPSGGHNISDYNFNTAMSRTTEFFKETLK